MFIPPWLQKKSVHPNDLKNKVSALKKEGKRIATLNGSFDLLHAGHLYIIYQASKQCDCLFVLLNTDTSIQKYKSFLRPIIPLCYRLEMMAALEFVDYVSWFDETDPRDILSIIQPDVHVNGAEYGSECIEAKIVESFGGKIHLVDRIPSLSTTQIVEKIQLCVT